MTNNTTTAISITDLHKHYGDVHALKGVNLNMTQGEFIALIGANGAGKTSLLSVLMGLLPQSKGDVQILGGKPGDMAVRQVSGVMLQSTALPDALKVRELVELFRSYYPAPRPLDELLALTGLGDLENRRYKALSGGQQRRVQFALALAGDPQLLFLDEPTVGLDMEVRREFWRILDSLKARGVTIILTSHYLDEIEALADRLVVIKEGEIIANDATGNIKRRVEHKNITCQTKLATAELEKIGGVLSVVQIGRLKTIATNTENTVLQTLLSNDPDLTDLMVESSSLEDAINSMIGSDADEETNHTHEAM